MVLDVLDALKSDLPSRCPRRHPSCAYSFSSRVHMDGVKWAFTSAGVVKTFTSAQLVHAALSFIGQGLVQESTSELVASTSTEGPGCVLCHLVVC